MTVKMAVLTPMPSPSDATAAAANVGDLTSVRKPKRMSRHNRSIPILHL
jgi:hypothetical protein